MKRRSRRGSYLFRHFWYHWNSWDIKCSIYKYICNNKLDCNKLTKLKINTTFSNFKNFHYRLVIMLLVDNLKGQQIDWVILILLHLHYMNTVVNNVSLKLPVFYYTLLEVSNFEWNPERRDVLFQLQSDPTSTTIINHGKRWCQ